MPYETITLTTDTRGVATLTLARPEKHNALNEQMITEITEAVGHLAANKSLRAVILTGSGKSFCAGGDLTWMRQQFTATRAERITEGRKLAMMLNALNLLPIPLIGRIQGQAFGGGIGMMSICDVAITVDNAKFGLTETRLGLSPATISPYVIARMGEPMARRVFMSSRIFPAEEAVTLGLAAKTVSVEQLDQAVEDEITPYLKCYPSAVAKAKQMTRYLGPPITDAIIDQTVEWLADAWEHPDAVKGITAFFDRQK